MWKQCIKIKAVVFLTNEKQFNEYIPPAIEILPGYSYLLAFLASFPGAKVGLHVKSYENRVYVSSISHGSLSETVFHVGDVIISVDDSKNNILTFF